MWDIGKGIYQVVRNSGNGKMYGIATSLPQNRIEQR